MRVINISSSRPTKSIFYGDMLCEINWIDCSKRSLAHKYSHAHTKLSKSPRRNSKDKRMVTEFVCGCAVTYSETKDKQQGISSSSLR